MKTPSFFELKTLVEYFSDELCNSQLQDVMSTEEGLVLSFYRFSKNPKMYYLVFDLDKSYPFCGLFDHNPWSKYKKTKPVSLFLNAHAKNNYLKNIEVFENLGRVLKLNFEDDCEVEFRLIPRQTNLLIKQGKKTISWYPAKVLAQNDLRYTKNNEIENSNESFSLDGSEIRSISFMMEQWLRFKGVRSTAEATQTLNPFEKWKKNKEKDLQKKKKAISAVKEQIDKFKNEEWYQIGEHLKVSGFKNIKPEWSMYVDFGNSVAINMQNCFEKAKAAKVKIKGASARLSILQREVEALSDLTIEKFEQFLLLQNSKPNNASYRKVEGRLRKNQIEESKLVAYMGKSATDNLDLLRRSKPHDLWLHLKDYPSAHAVIHRQKDQKVSDSDIHKMASWLVKEGLSDKIRQGGGKYLVVIVECRHVKPLKGDKLGRVTYQNAREILIAV